jgi:hypothetical protein
MFHGVSEQIVHDRREEVVRSHGRVIDVGFDGHRVGRASEFVDAVAHDRPEVDRLRFGRRFEVVESARRVAQPFDVGELIPDHVGRFGRCRAFAHDEIEVASDQVEAGADVVSEQSKEDGVALVERSRPLVFGTEFAQGADEDAHDPAGGDVDEDDAPPADALGQRRGE